MIYQFEKQKISGVYVLKPSIFSDKRGSITKVFSRSSFEELGVECDWGETLITENKEKNIIRGFHFQRPPFDQAKTICLASGRLQNWILDIRKGSSTFGNIIELVLDAEEKRILYLPRGVANCYRILEDDTTVLYNLTNCYSAESASGINWKSIDLGIDRSVCIASDKDNNLCNWESFDSPFVYGENC